MTAVQKRLTRYTEEEVLKGLAIYALMSGAAAKVEALLQDQGLGHIPITTLRDWAYRVHRDEYVRIKGEVDQHVRSQLADSHMTLAHAAAEIEHKVITQLNQRLDNEQLEAKDLANIMKSAAISGGVHTDKSQDLAARSSSLPKHDFSDLVRALKTRGIGLTFEGSEKARELPAESNVVDVAVTARASHAQS